MTSSEPYAPLEGGCPCSNVRYHLERKPLFVHCCHCSWCQRETGSAFGLNAIIETKFVTVTTSEKPVINFTPSESTLGQRMARCPSCKFAVWSNYGDNGDFVRFIRVGTLDEPAKCPPSINIYTDSKLPWVTLDSSVPAMKEYYDRNEYWPKESLERLADLKKSV